MPSANEIIEGLQYQSADEEIPYQIITTPWGSNPSAPSVAAFLVDTGAVVTTTVFPTNTPTVNGDTITLSPLKSLVKSNTYRIEVLFTCGATKFECFFKVFCDH